MTRLSVPAEMAPGARFSVRRSANRTPGSMACTWGSATRATPPRVSAKTSRARASRVERRASTGRASRRSVGASKLQRRVRRLRSGRWKTVWRCAGGAASGETSVAGPIPHRAADSASVRTDARGGGRGTPTNRRGREPVVSSVSDPQHRRPPRRHGLGLRREGAREPRVDEPPLGLGGGVGRRDRRAWPERHMRRRRPSGKRAP